MRIINVTKNVDRLNLALTVEKRHLNSERKILGGGYYPPYLLGLCEIHFECYFWCLRFVFSLQYRSTNVK